jgi:hypothetical protein
MALERLDWRNDIVSKIKEILNERRQQGVPAATLRGIFLHPCIFRSYREYTVAIQESIKGPSYSET